MIPNICLLVKTQMGERVRMGLKSRVVEVTTSIRMCRVIEALFCKRNLIKRFLYPHIPITIITLL
jgi:hypothetical protein